MANSQTKKYSLEQIMASSILAWLKYGKIQLEAGEFAFQNHKYQIDWLIEDHPNQCWLKGAQIGATAIQVLKSVHGMIGRRYKQGCLYLFPTQDDVSDFSKGRWQPLINNNPATIGTHVRNTDAANIKRIGNAMLYLRGARPGRKIQGVKKTSSKLKSIPVDRVVYDEKDEMDPAMVTLAEARVAHSERPEFATLSTPTIPDWGVDRDYQDSDQRIWLIECTHCGAETCLELEFPDCLKRRADGSVYRACKKCGEEIFPRDGYWISREPANKHRVGWWISQLNSAYVDPKRILDAYENPPNGDLSEVFNSMLGMAYIAAENRLTEHDVLSCCCVEPMPASHDGPCAAGVDVGKELNVVIGAKINDNYHKIIKVARVTVWNDVYDLFQRYGVRCAVFDLYPETRKVREAQNEVSFPVYGCDYQENQRGVYRWDERSMVVVVNRTEICDETHDMVKKIGRLQLPRESEEVRVFAKQMAQIAKVLEEDEETGSKIYRYRKLGADHYRHAFNYFRLAAERVDYLLEAGMAASYSENPPIVVRKFPSA